MAEELRGKAPVGIVVEQSAVEREADAAYIHHRHWFATRSEGRLKIATWITDFYNARRLHSVCDFVSPVEFEQRYWAQQVWQQAA